MTSAATLSSDLLAWLRSAPTSPRTCYVVHGEEQLATRIEDEFGRCAALPHQHEQVLR